jgi:Mn-dependent DtxR family transcriptional regulator
MVNKQTLEKFDELFPAGERVNVTKLCFFLNISRPTATELLKYLYDKGRLSCISKPGIKGKTYKVLS